MRRPYLVILTRVDTVVTGTVERGTVRAGDTVFAHTARGTIPAVVESIETPRAVLGTAAPGATVGIRLRGERLNLIQRGDVIAGSEMPAEPGAAPGPAGM
jgi:translation elongation factor EF-Tu-like GTPase